MDISAGQVDISAAQVDISAHSITFEPFCSELGPSSVLGRRISPRFHTEKDISLESTTFVLGTWPRFLADG